MLIKKNKKVQPNKPNLIGLQESRNSQFISLDHSRVFKSSASNKQKNIQLKSESKQQLIQRIQKQHQQIQQLLQIVTSYKNKVQQFGQYQKVISQLQKKKYEKSKQYRDDQYQDFEQNITIKTKKGKLNHSNKISHAYDIVVYSEKFKYSYPLKFQLTQNTIIKKQNHIRQKQSILRKKQANKENIKQTQNKKFNKKPNHKAHSRTNSFNQDESQNLPIENNKTITYAFRSPSVQNLKTIHNCYKLLKK